MICCCQAWAIIQTIFFPEWNCNIVAKTTSEVEETADDRIEVPIDQLSAAALNGLAESFVLREGTDYGEQTFSMAEKVAHVVEQIKRGEAVVLFDAATDSINIVSQSER